MEYYSAIKRNPFEAILMRWTNLEPIIQVKSEREEQISYINAYTWKLERWYWLFAWQQWRCRHREQTYGHGERAGEGEIYGKSNMETFTTRCKKIRQPVEICCMTQGAQTNALWQSGGVRWDERWEAVSRGRDHMYTYKYIYGICIPIHFNWRVIAL